MQFYFIVLLILAVGMAAAGKGEKFTFSTEAEMIDYLSQKYDVTPKDVKPKTPTSVGRGRGRTPKPDDLNLSLGSQRLSSVSQVVPPPTPSLTSLSSLPKIPPFSGDDPTPRGEISYFEWHHEVKCLRRDASLSESQVFQALRSSLRGTARLLVVSLGDSVSVDAVLHKLSVSFSEPSRQGVTMKEFYSAVQGNESVAAFGCRLEVILQRALEGGSVPTDARNEILCEQLWSGLKSDALKSHTSHKRDAATDYDQFLMDVRKIEKDMGLSVPPTVSKAKVAGVDVQSGTKVSAEVASMSYVDQSLQTMEQRLSDKIRGVQSGMDKRLNSILHKLDNLTLSSQHTQPPPQPQWNTPPPPNYTQPPPSSQPMYRGPPPSNPPYANHSGRGKSQGSNRRGQHVNSQQVGPQVHPN